MFTIAPVFTQAKALLDDSKGQFATPDYLLPFIQLAQAELQKVALENPNMGQLISVIVIPNVPIDTPSLKSITPNPFADGGALALLTDVISLKERATGGSRSEQDWMWMDRAMDVPTFNQGAFNSYFAWRGDDILLSGCNQIMDLRIFGKFSPKPFTTDAKCSIVPGTGEILAFRAASLAAGARGNDSMAIRWDTKAQTLQDGFFNNAMMEMQNTRNRNRPFSSRGNSR